MRSGKVRRKSVRIKTLRQRTSKKRKKRVYRKTKTRTRKIKRKRRTKKKMRGGGIVIAENPEGYPTSFYEGEKLPEGGPTHDISPGDKMELLDEKVHGGEEWVKVRTNNGMVGWAKKRNVRREEPEPEPEPAAGGAADADESLQQKINKLKSEGRFMPQTLEAADRWRNSLQALNEELITRMKATIKSRHFVLGDKAQWDTTVAQYKRYHRGEEPLDPGWILLQWKRGVPRELESDEKTLLGKWASDNSGNCPEGCVKQYIMDGLVVDDRNLPVGIKIQGVEYKLVLTYV